MVLLLALTTLEELPSTVKVVGSIPVALLYKAASASTSDALSIAVLMSYKLILLLFYTQLSLMESQ